MAGPSHTRSTLILGLIWSLAVLAVGGAAATGALDSLRSREDDGASVGSAADTTVPPIEVSAPPLPDEAAPVETAPADQTTSPPPTVDRTQEYLDAIVADTMDGLDEGTRGVVVCVSEAILRAVGGAAALEAAGVSPQHFGVADDLTELGIPIDPGAATTIAAAAADCGLGPVIATDLTDGFAEALRQVASALTGTELARVVDEADVVCLRDRVSSHPRLTEGFASGYVFGDVAAADQGFADAFESALGACPHTFVPYFVAVARAFGLAPTADAEACIEREVVSRAQRLAEAFVGGSVEDAQSLSVEVFETCESTFAA